MFNTNSVPGKLLPPQLAQPALATKQNMSYDLLKTAKHHSVCSLAAMFCKPLGRKYHITYGKGLLGSDCRLKMICLILRRGFRCVGVCLMRSAMQANCFAQHGHFTFKRSLPVKDGAAVTAAAAKKGKNDQTYKHSLADKTVTIVTCTKFDSNEEHVTML